MGKRTPVVFDMSYCLNCGSPQVEWHHIFFGRANRKISDELGYIAPLCPECHRGSKGVHFNKPMDLFIKRAAQEHFEKNNGTREDFIKTFGKSYL